MGAAGRCVTGAIPAMCAGVAARRVAPRTHAMRCSAERVCVLHCALVLNRGNEGTGGMMELSEFTITRVDRLTEALGGLDA